MTTRTRRRVSQVLLAATIMCGFGFRHAAADAHPKTVTIGTACVMDRGGPTICRA